ncbi:MAG: amino acid adenylation domain-containing protein [Bacteroidales bacterium]|nr:amino acid adenylation domain-containing protein [Bacteroidales bacterium]
MKMKDVHIFLNGLRLNAGAIWLVNDIIKFSAPKKFEKVAKDFIEENKNQIVSILNENQIFSKKKFLDTVILRDNSLTYYPLSLLQERLWFIEKDEVGIKPTRTPLVFEFDDTIDLEGIKYAIRQVVSRHEVLGSTIEQHDSQGCAAIVHNEILSFEEIIFTNVEEAKSALKEDINRPFDLSRNYPIRVKFYATSEVSLNSTLLLIDIHPIVADNWSLNIFQKELNVCYEAYINKNFCLPTLDIQYKDYALWQRTYLTEEILTKQLEYWKTKLWDYQNLDLPTDHARSNKTNFSNSSQKFIFDKVISQQLRALANKYNTSLHNVMLSSFGILLGKYTSQSDIVVGRISTNRQNPQTEGLIGLFANRLAVRIQLSEKQNFESLIKQVHKDQVEAQLNQDLPFEKLVKELDIQRDALRHPVFQIMLSVNSYEKDLRQKKHLNTIQQEENYDVAEFDLSIILDDSREEISGRIMYAVALFEKETIERLISNYTYLIVQLTESPKKFYSQFGLLDPKEYKKIVYQWNETNKDYPGDKTIHQLFQEQAEKSPEEVALVYEQQKLTYKELNEKSNQLARHIQTQYKQRTNQSLNSDSFIALYLDRNLEMVVGILAVLKAGGAYVPIDPGYPQERVDYILEDTCAELLLSQKHLVGERQNQLPRDKVINIDLAEDIYSKEDASKLPQHSKSTDLAYVIYTSGTTGRPKGVMVEHRAAVNTLFAMRGIYNRSKISRVTAYTAYTFDVSVSEIFNSLIGGLELHILAGNTRRDGALLADYMISNKINLAYLPPILLGQLPERVYPDLKGVVYAGEPCERQTAKLWSARAELYNYYGPTEASIYATGKRIQECEVEQIGLPIQNTKAYILDPNGIPVPIGVIGELYIGGAGLARGYLKRPDLTGERFIPNPYATESDKTNGYTRLYRTGDLVRWLSDGNIEFIGRNDDQVKIRGYRIELGEIEYALTQILGIKQGCVLVKERKTDSGSSKYLVAYYVQDNSENLITQETILDSLSHLLPEYMVPSALVEMKSFPLTINGKLDKSALPNPVFSSSTGEYVAPATEMEIELCRIWQKVLGIDRVGVTDEFFRIGGNSILAIQVSHQMSKALGFDTQVADVFRYKNISQLLFHCIDKAQISISKIEGNEAILSFAQDRLWFIEQYEEGTNAYHIPAVYELNVDVDVEGIKYAIRQVVSRHEVLRSTIESRNGQGIQVVHDAPLGIEEVTLLKHDDYEALIREDINRPFNLSSEYPIRVKLYKIPSDDSKNGNPLGRTLLLINTHHIATDGWSVDILQKELVEYYKAYVRHNFDFGLPALEIQYKDYAVWQRTYLSGEILEKQIKYWKDKLSDYQNLDLPIDFPRPNRVDYKGAYLRFSFDRQISNKLRMLALQSGTTLHGVMLSGLSILLGKYTGQDDIIIGSPTANRHHRQTEELIGFFVNTQVNRILLNPEQSYESLIKEVHQGQVEAQLNQDLPFERLVEELGVTRDTTRHPIFQVMFSVQDFSNQGKVFDYEKGYLMPIEIESAYEVELFDLSIFIDDSQEEIAGQISYATSLFQRNTLERFIHHYTHLVSQLAETPSKKHSQISLLSSDEYRQIIYQWNETDKDYPKDRTIHQLFQEQVEKTPNSVALEYDGHRLTYKELNEKSNQLARHIREQYQQKTGRSFAVNSIIALYLDRGIESVVGMLGIMKAGGAYVPIETTYPQERVDYILGDTQTELVLSQRHLTKDGPNLLPQDKIIYIDITEGFFGSEDKSNLPPHSKSEDLAYIIYTSGTTGKPKGVELTHKGLCNLAFVQRNLLGINAESKMLQYASLVFDASVWEIFSTLPFGAELSIIPSSIKQDAYLLSDYLASHKITVTLLPPVMLSSMPYTQLPALQTLLVGGDLSSLETMDKWSRGRTLINAYGPTEGTVISTMHTYAERDLNTNIGKPIDNTKAYVLSSDLNPVPIGIIGELYIGGISLAQGYLKRSDLTEERFVHNPFATQLDREKGYTRLYRTGDFVKWLPDGNLEFIGRNDGQVKIHGHRIELGEIEHALNQIPGVKNSCVLVKERKTDTGNNKYLVAYYVLDHVEDLPTQSAIHDKLSQGLPDYMIPSALVPIESFPLTINGKLDKRALPDPDFSLLVESYVTPTTNVETEVCKIWREVLGLERVGITDDFFRIGGNSILAIQVSHRMSKALACDIKVADVFKQKTISQLLIHSLGHAQINIPKIITNEAPLSFAQDRLWFIEQFEEGTNAYHIPAVYELVASTDVEGVKYALRQIVSRHEILRSTIVQIEGHGVQVVQDKPLSIEEIVIPDNGDYESLLKADINRPFNLSSEYPIRVKFYHIQPTREVSKNKSSRTLLLINTHHIASDGWSMDILQKELNAYYEGFVNQNVDFSLPTLDIQYKDYAVWQRTYLTGDILEKQLRYWANSLSGYQSLELPTDFPRPSKVDYSGSSQVFTIDHEVSRQLRMLAQRHGTTLHSVMLGSVSILLNKYTSQDDIIIGSPIANRHHRQTEGLIGFFINTQANRILLNRTQSYDNLILQVHQGQVEAQLHQDLPFEKLVEELGVTRDTSRHPIFQVIFSVQSFGNQTQTQKSQKNYIRPLHFEAYYEIEKFDLSIFIDDSLEEITGQISYATSLFHKETIERLIAHYKHLLTMLVESPEMPYSRLGLLDTEEYQRIVYQWNETGREYSRDKTLHQLFQDQAEKTPMSTALVYEQQKLTYKELNERSNQLAQYIRNQYQQRTNQPLNADTPIALYLNRSLEMVIGILAVLKAGGTYVPIDITYPLDRVDYILEDTQAEIILSQKYINTESQAQLPEGKIICIDLDEKLYKEEDSSNLLLPSSSSDLAYIIYTSGTTGRPKGVMVEHRAVVNTLFSMQGIYDGSKISRVTAYTSYTFDVSVSEIFNSLIEGLELHILAGDTRRDSALLADYLMSNRINLAYLPPILLGQLPQRVYPDLSMMIYAGEPCDRQTAKIWSARVELFNYYGPTETSIYATGKRILGGEVEQIGRPIQNIKVYILDPCGNPVPVGIIGELHISGAGLARGYLKRPELTVERFIPNPFATESDRTNGYTRLYKTGDLVRWLPDGNIEFIGRNDDQVKIRGFRIELGEVEHAILQVTGVRQCCVLVKERKTETGNNRYLVAYYVLDDEHEMLTSEEILGKMSQLLPEYMMPSVLIAMDSLPLNINGKLDKRALPEPDFNLSTEDYVAPTTDIELELCRIWQEILGLDRVGTTDDFFRIGGNSILAIQVSHRMSKVLNFDVKVADIFKYKTISQLLSNNIRKIQIHIDKTLAKQADLSFAQDRLWFIEQYEEGTNAYHIPALYELDVNTNVKGLKYAISKIVERHEILRSTIEQNDDQQNGTQVIHDNPLDIEEVALSDKEDYDALVKYDINRPFNLNSEYPIRVKFYYIQSSEATPEEKTNRTLLLINTHHIASDGWSIDVFQKELYVYYDAYINNNKDFSLPALDIQYKDYAVWQRKYLTGETFEKQMSYWKTKLQDCQPLELPSDYNRPTKIDYRGACQEFTLGKSVSQKLREMAQHHGTTLHSVMLSSVGILMGKYTGQDDIVIGSPIANRHHRQTEGLIGYFVNIQANRLVIKIEQSFKDLILQVHLDQVEAQLHQDLPFEKLVDELGVARDTSRHPIFQIVFGVQNFMNTNKTSDQQKNYLRPLQTESVYEIEKFDLSIFIDDSLEEITGQISYATSLFCKETIERLIAHYKYLLTLLVESPEMSYNRIGLLDQDEYQRIVYQWNKTENDYPKDCTIHQLFQEQVVKTPNAIALEYDGQRLTYKELNEKSNQLAWFIKEQYQQKTGRPFALNSLIALYLDRGLEAVIGMFAIMKAGGAYVPMDTNYPQERVDYILEDTQAELVLCQRHIIKDGQNVLPNNKIVFIDLSEDIFNNGDRSNLPPYSKPEDLAYVIYTSGTTGRPKGVELIHRGLCNLAFIQKKELGINYGSKMLQYASLVFDASVWEIFSTLPFGGELSIVPTNVRQDPSMLCDYLADRKITTTLLPPVLLSAMPYTQLPDLKTLLVGGDLSTQEIMDKWSKGRTLINAYGPTEGTVISTMHTFADGDSNTNIGKPLDNIKVYVLDNNFIPVPVGIIGELYVGGIGLAKGYLKRPDLTEDRFVFNPFATEVDRENGFTRLYKTGDLVKWLPDGCLEFIGRNDGQVKIRGYRIELGEIEHALAQLPCVMQSCVLVKERKTETGNDKYLVGYYVLDHNNDKLNQSTIQNKLSQVLPDYMVPSVLVPMESFPITISGKLDKRVLPDPEFGNEEDYVKPETDLEIKLCQLYAEVLGMESDQISTHQNFFRMGGNSILSIRLKQKLSQLDEFKQISVADLFKFNSISKLIQSIKPDNEVQYNLQYNKVQNNDHEIAIISISGAFSGVSNIAELWQLIANQREGIQFYSKDECRELGVEEVLLEDFNYVPVAGKVKNIELFDPLFWDISPNEAKLLDPQIRKFIEHCWFALESSGYAQLRKNLNIGVFAGSGNSDYFYHHILNGEMAEQINLWDASSSNNKDAITTKTAFLLGLLGPAISINTACSTGLISVIEACKNLRLGACDMALAGGVSLSMPEQVGYVYQEGMILSKDGHCKTFDKESSGTTGGSGVGVVLLKRLGDAIKDKDNILGVIKGYSSNNDGDRKTGYTAPSVIGQSECIINAQRMAGVTSDQIDYVECHGTATNLGDPIEIQALREAFEYNLPKENRSKNKTILGAVKANIGHTDSAAGTAGLIKVCAMLQNSTFPGQPNFSEPNPELHLDQTSFEITKENREWLPNPNKQRLAGVSSFGVGGTNAHVIIGDYSPSTRELEETIHAKKEQGDLAQHIILISAKNRQSLEQYRQELAKYLDKANSNGQPINLQDITYTLQERREHFSFRSAYCARNVSELLDKLRLYTSYAETHAESSNKVVFMFPGQGAQYIHMAKALYDNEQHFKDCIDQCIAIANRHVEINLFDVMYPGDEISQHDINETQWTQVSLFTIEYAMAKYLEHLGVIADAYIGHSIGEYVAATLSGVFTLEDAIRVVVARGQLMQAMQSGCMLAINAKEEVVKTIVEEYGCEIAVINSSEDIVVSGTNEAIKKLKIDLDGRAISTISLTTSHAFHSRMMEDAANEFEGVFKNIKLKKPIKYFVSNLTGEIAKEEVTTCDYWCKQLRNTVQFAKGVDCLSRQYNHKICFIEVGTGKGLSSFVKNYKSANGYKSLNTLQLLPSAKEVRTYQNIESKEHFRAKLWMSGIIRKPNESKLFQNANLVSGLPTYQFNYQKCWLEKGSGRDTKKVNSVDEMFYKRSWERTDIKASWNTEEIKHKNILVLINDKNIQQDGRGELLDLLSSHCNYLNFVIHQQTNNIKPEFTFDFSDLSHIKTIFNEKARTKAIDLVIYLSPSIDIENPSLDIFAVRNIFNWSKDTGNKIPKFVSISFDNYEVIGNERLQERASIIFGVTKSIPFEYFTSGTKAFHIDLSSQESSYKDLLLPVLVQDEGKDLVVIRGKYQWFPTYQQVISLTNQIKTNTSLQSDGSVFLITGGLGGIGYAYANSIVQKDSKCTLILLGRTSEANLRDDYRTRLSYLRDTKHHIIYSPIDIGCEDASPLIEKLLAENSIKGIDVILHTAGVAAKSALTEKTSNDIELVVRPKIVGIENLIKLAKSVRINYLVSCSSLASILPSLGNMEYTAANLYLDEISYRSHPNILHILTIGLNQISDTGMAIDFMKSLTTDQGKTLNSIKSYEFSDALGKLVHTKTEKSILLSRFDFNKEYSDNIRQQNYTDEKPKNQKKISILEDNYTEAEYQIAQIFGDVLGVEEISLHDDFFSIGGNSILAIQVSHRISKILDYDVKVSDIFKHRSIKVLLSNVSKLEVADDNIKWEF